MTRGITRTDVVAIATILALGVFQLLLVRRDDAFVSVDANYLELADSITEGTPYGFNGNPGALFPPGLPSLLALLCVSTGCGHTLDTRVMAIFSTLGFLFSYALIRRVGGRTVAAVACLLPMSSPEIFSLTTNWVSTDVPYFAVMAMALWLALDLDAGHSTLERVARSGLFAVTLAVALLLRSAAVSLLGAAAAWLGATWLMDRSNTRRRLVSLAPALVLGVAVQGTWMVWAAHHEVSEWPLNGYPKSYLSQLLVVNGNQPELGEATWRDLVPRVDRNLRAYTGTAVQLLVHHGSLQSWGSPAVSAALLLVLVGLGTSCLQQGGAFFDWAFLLSAAMLILWPWDVEIRFLLPFLPLSCWYLWRGAQEVARQARLRPRALGAAGALLSVSMGLIAGRIAIRQGTIQPAASACFWTVLGGSALWLVRRREIPFRTVFASPAFARAAAAASLLLTAGIVVFGVVGQLGVGRDNLAFEATKSRDYPDIEAAHWLREHTGTDAVLMARDPDIVHHHSGRRVVWFPPLSDPNVLMQGIRRLGVQWVVVITDRKTSYWRPRESDIFEPLFEAHPEAFLLEAAGARWRVFAVNAGSERRAEEHPDVAAAPGS